LQSGRNIRRQKYHSSMIVKTYALLPRPLPDGVYTAFAVKSGKIVKTYALWNQMQAIAKKDLLSP
jgi:predicted DCC family thiol-disulfide oxidoreductase YuxK